VPIIASAAVPSQYRLDRQSTRRLCPSWCTDDIPAGDDGVIHTGTDTSGPLPVSLEQMDRPNRLEPAGVRVADHELTLAGARQLAAALVRTAAGRPHQPECLNVVAVRIEVRDALDDRLDGLTYTCYLHLRETLAAIAATGAVARAMPVRDLETVLACGYVTAFVGGVAA
jgi:hypothetical protein